METRIRLYVVLLSACFLTGCNNNCCDCEDNLYFKGQGNLRIIRNWDKVWEGITKPQELDVYLYSPFHDLQYLKVFEDTTYLSLPFGEYNVLAINNTTNVSGMGDYNAAKISLPCWEVDNKYITSEAPMTISASEAVQIDENATTELIIAPNPIIFVVNFRFIFTQNDSLVDNIKNCNAELHGVTTSKMLSDKKNSGNLPAILQFTAQKKAKGTYDKTISVLGFSGKENMLNMAIEFNDGQIKNVCIDLTDQFDFSLSPIQNCIIRLSLDENLFSIVVREILIEEWAQGTDNNIELQNK